MSLLRYLIPVAGRMSPSEATRFGEGIVHGCGFLAFGPLVVVFDLPAFLRKADPVARIPSVEELNTQIRLQMDRFDANFPPRN